MIYDCIIVGGGPAGSFAAYLLAKSGYRTVLLERRPVYDEKICGGYFSGKALSIIRSSGVELDSFEAYHGKKIYLIKRWRGEQYQEDVYSEQTHGLGVLRKEFDAYLAAQAENKGTRLIMGKCVTNILKDNNIFRVDEFASRYVILAAGARGIQQFHNVNTPKKQQLLAKQTVGISEIIHVTGNCSLSEKSVKFWFDKNDTDYFWSIPVGECLWNIGYWCQQATPAMREKFEEGRRRYIEQYCEQIDVYRHAKGSFCGSVDLSSLVNSISSVCIGDMKGCNNPLVGAGLSQAFESALQVVNFIKSAE